MVPGEIKVQEGNIQYNAGKEAIKMQVVNTGDRPVQIGSHYHFYEVNDSFLNSPIRQRLCYSEPIPYKNLISSKLLISSSLNLLLFAISTIFLATASECFNLSSSIYFVSLSIQFK